ncbi:hypothetical protein NF27_EY01990 [Candidatus Jidaibacter acanthamoeba]|uniref:Uncharacterized protein n=2 Tax=Candidatus Jidaibacter acanthamoebae TaxID=86105 RepID=A0A0C1QM08_9RICK|nr:hypothetical protein NF27_EY01990 [Candidatus Jidaibacter acanthamoeba]
MHLIMKNNSTKFPTGKNQIYKQSALFDHLIRLCQGYLKNKKSEKDIDQFLRSGNDINDK